METLIALEGLGGGESIGCVAAVLRLNPEIISKLLEYADAYRAGPKRLIRMVIADPFPPEWFVEDDDAPDQIADFAQEASGYRIIEEPPGDPNLKVEAFFLDLTSGMGDDVYFRWRALTDCDEEVFTVKVPEHVLHNLS